MIMVTLECTTGAVDVSTMCAAAAVRPAVSAFGSNLLLPTVRPHSLAGVGLHEVLGSDSGWGGQPTEMDAVKHIDPTYFPTRLGPPPDSPPVN